MGHIYLILEREWVLSNHKVYKIGRCKDIFDRKSGYPKNSILLLCHFVSDELFIEQKCKEFFKNDDYIKAERDYGTEYFSGNLSYIKHVIYKIVSNAENDLNLIKINGEFKNSNSDLYKVLLERYNFTYNNENFVPYSKIEDYVIKEKKYPITEKKLPRELTALGFKSKSKWLDGKNVQIRVGISEKGWRR